MIICDLSAPEREGRRKKRECRLTDFIWTVALAETSLYIPGFDEQPVSVTVLGVGPDSRTTWQIQPGQPTGTVPPAPFPLTGMFVLPRPSLIPTKDVRAHYRWSVVTFPTHRVIEGKAADFNSIPPFV